jgi:hypothetical protein
MMKAIHEAIDRAERNIVRKLHRRVNEQNRDDIVDKTGH